MKDYLEHALGIKYRSVDEHLLPPESRERYSRRLLAVMMRLEGHALKAVSNETGISPGEIVRLLKRFKIKDEEGICHGEKALIPNLHIKPYERNKPLPVKRSEQKSGMVGAMGLLLRTYPKIYKEFSNAVLRTGRTLDKGVKFQKKNSIKNFIASVMKKVSPRASGLSVSKGPPIAP